MRIRENTMSTGLHVLALVAIASAAACSGKGGHRFALGPATAEGPTPPSVAPVPGPEPTATPSSSSDPVAAPSSPAPPPAPPPGPWPAPDALPDFHLVDVNEHSSTSGVAVSPRDQLGRISGWYFGRADCSHCRMQLGFLDAMQAELIAENPATVIRLLGVNGAEAAADGRLATMNRSIPWLQDTVEQAVWSSWSVTMCDLVVLDRGNAKVAVYNLETAYDLSVKANYDEVKRRLREAAGEAP